MSQVIAAFNMTLDGVCDHTAGIASRGLHQHYADLIDGAGVILYGRHSYQLMQFWQTVIANPSGDESMDRFAAAIDRVPKLLFSRTLRETGWHSATLAGDPLETRVSKLKQQPGKPTLVGSRSLIIQLLNSGLIDQFQICIHPVIEGKGLPLFDGIREKIDLKLVHTKTLDSGAIVLYYEPTSPQHAGH